MSANESFDFSSLERVNIPVTVGDQQYILKEASGGAAKAYRNALMACMVLGPEGKPIKLSGLASVEPLLVSLCLVDSKGRPVDQKTVESWPARIVKVLFEKAKEISGLTEEAEERSLLGKALALNSSPIELDDLRQFVVGLGDEYKPLIKWLAPTEEEKVKNSQSSTTDGSD
jgi:hypothetical protein